MFIFSFSIPEEARKKKFGKKKKKHLQKLIMIGMLLKSKIGLLLQLLSTHFQVKFFVIAIISLLINAARFWIDLKKSHRPAKVIYYEHAQHQHHYDHDDDHGIWGRSSDEAPQELAYGAYAPEH